MSQPGSPAFKASHRWYPARDTPHFKTMKYLLTAFIALIAFLALDAEAATSAGGDLHVGATILASCTASGTSLNFGGSIDPLRTSGAIDATAALNVTCTNTTPYSIGLSAGTNASAGNTAARAMKNGGYALAYQLYLDAARSKVWGEDSNGYTGVGTGSGQNLTIYGRLPSLAGAVPGNYSDTVTVTITY